MESSKYNWKGICFLNGIAFSLQHIDRKYKSQTRAHLKICHRPTLIQSTQIKAMENEVAGADENPRHVANFQPALHVSCVHYQCFTARCLQPSDNRARTELDKQSRAWS